MAEQMMSKETMTMSTPRNDARLGLARRAARACAALIIAGLCFGAFASTASAGQEISEFEVGSLNPQAGGHPDLTARLKLESPGQPEVARNVTVNFPEGVFGNPGAIFRCRAAVFVVNHCQAGSQAGLVTIVANYEGNPSFVLGTAPIYNLETVGEEEAARLGFVAPTINVPVILPIQVRSDSDYGLRLSINSISQTLALNSAEMTIWGFPADGGHDPERFYAGEPGSPPGCPGSLVADCLSAPHPKAGLTVRPFTDNPSVCTTEPLPVTIEVVTYQDPVPTHAVSEYPPTTGCENQKFDPVFNLGLTTGEADAPSGLDIQLKADQFLAGEAPSQSTLRTATLTLPQGLSVNPDAADGQTSCSDAEAGFGTNLPGKCPDNAKIGTVEVITPALEGPLHGSLYIGEPKPGNQYRVFLVFDGFGIHAKLVADVHPDPVTGQVTMSVTDLPQVPFEEFNLHLFASDRGLMATPTQCRLYEATANLVPWNATQSPQRSSPLVTITSGPNGRPCPGQVRPFNPRLVAGTSHPVAGAFSNFHLKLDRDDGDQFLGDLTFRMPPGFTGDLRGISYCPENSIAAAALKLGRAEQASPSCPVSSQIGTTNVAAGPGSHPFHAVGKMYLAGPLKGAPLSLAAITPALAGPYDYGTQVVRVALHVDPRTAQVYAESDTVPSIIGGIPIRMRSIRVNIDRQRFTINPTNCSPFTVDSQGIGDQGTVTDFSSYFQSVNCATLAFRPKMTIRQLGSRKATKRTRNPRLRFDLFTRGGDANLESVAVTLPKAFAIDQRHLGNICSKSQLEAELCEGRQPIGHAWVRTPLLDEPLQGPAYAVSGFGKLPRVAFVLDGQVTLVPQAESSSVRNGHLKTVVPVIPDAPVGHFRLTLLGGSKGYLVNTRDLCASKTVTGVQFTGQNGKTRNQRVQVKTPCGNDRRAKRSRHRRP
jgi:hypothetical protein